MDKFSLCIGILLKVKSSQYPLLRVGEIILNKVFLFPYTPKVGMLICLLKEAPFIQKGLGFDKDNLRNVEFFKCKRHKSLKTVLSYRF